MSVLLFIVFIAIVLVVGFLYAPINLYVDTDQNRYEIYQLPVFRFSVVHSADTFLPNLRLFGINIRVRGQQKKASVKTKNTKTKRPFHRPLASWRYLATRVITSFKVNQAVVDIDTDDVIVNAQLIPLFMAVNNKHVHCSSNFNGRVYLHLEMSNQPARLLWIFIQFLIKK